MTLGKRLRTARYARNLTQEALAGDTFSKSYISAVERDKLTPSIPALRALAERLAVPLAFLLGEHDLALTSPPEEAILARRLDAAEALLYQGHPTAALERLGQYDVGAAVRQQNPQRWDWLQGWALLQQHQEVEALAVLEQGLEEAVASQAPCAVGHFAFTLATAQVTRHSEAAENGFQTALRCAAEIGDHRLLSGVEEQYGALLAAQGRYRDAYLHQHAAIVAAARMHSSPSAEVQGGESRE
jgi:transcriptional regulator with XRE-family HTH domain